MADVPMYVISENASSERRITPSWTVGTLKSKLEPMTGIPPSAQRLRLQTTTSTTPLEAADEEAMRLSDFELVAYSEIHVIDTRPPSMRVNLSDTSAVERYVMPDRDYEKKTDSVLAWKRARQLGRFDPGAAEQEAAKVRMMEREVERRGIEVGRRCRVVGAGGGEGGEGGRRGEIRHVGAVEEIPGKGAAGPWVGVRLDEPVGRNDGSIGGKRYWEEEEAEGGMKFGVFVRPDRVEVGAFPVEDLEDLEEM